MTVERVRESGELPGSDVSGEEENAFASRVGAREVFESVIDDGAGEIFAGVAAEDADFSELAAQRDEFAAQQAPAFGLGHFREGEGKILQTDAAQPTVKCVDG